MIIRAACIALLVLCVPAHALQPIPTDDPFMIALNSRMPAVEACVPKSTAPSTVTVRLLPATSTTAAQTLVLQAPPPPLSVLLPGVKIPGVHLDAEPLPPAATDPAIIACVVDAVRATPAHKGEASARDIVVQLAPVVVYRQVRSTPALTKTAISAVLEPTFPAIARCVDRRTAADGAAAAATTIALDFDIARDGTVVIKKLTPDVPDHLAVCTREGIKGLVFPWPPAAPLNVKMPVNFSTTTPTTTP